MARTVAIVDYRGTWPAEFDRLAAGLRSAYGPAAQRIDHIGSTAVPGLAAKDVIDVQVAHVHVRGDGRFHHRYPLLCRDYLRAGPAAARAEAWADATAWRIGRSDA